MDADRALDDLTDRTVRTTMLIGLAPGVVLAVLLGLLVHPIVGVVLGLVVAGGWAALVWARAGSAVGRVLSPVGASPLVPGAEPRLENLLESVCVVGGIPEPTVQVLAVDGLNAAAIADGQGATFVLTRGLLRDLGRIELEAVLANLATRVKDGSARYATTVLALPVPGSVRSGWLDRGLGEQSSVRADLAAVGLTKYPPGLISALGVMQDHGTSVGKAPAATAPLWLADPAGSQAGKGPEGRTAVDPAADRAPQPLSLRIAVLQEL